MRRSSCFSGLATALLAFGALADGVADPSSVPANASILTLDRIFSSSEFDLETPGLFKWHKDGTAYFTFEATADTHAGKDLVRYDLVTSQRQVIAPASWFIPATESTPLPVENFELSTDGARLLLHTNSKRVSRRNTRGDYWVLDLASRNLQKLGGNAAPSTLMFAKFSPEGTRVAYVRENNLYVQELRRMRITALTTSGSATLTAVGDDDFNLGRLKRLQFVRKPWNQCMNPFLFRHWVRPGRS